MAKSVIFQVDAEFDETLPILYRNAAMNAGTLAVLDALDAYSWPKQAGAVAGDVWRNKVDGRGSVIVPAGASVGWDGGFTFGPPVAESIDLPSEFTLAANEEKRLIIIWFRHDTQVLGPGGGFGIASSGTTSAGLQWGLMAYRSESGQGPLRVTGDGNAGGYVYTIDPAPAPGKVYQVGIEIWKTESGRYQYRIYVDGVYAGVFNTTRTAMPAPTAAYAGKHFGAANEWTGKIYRMISDPLTAGLSAADVVAADYALCNGRFS